LNRQIVFNENDVGSLKILKLKEKIELQNNSIKVNIIEKSPKTQLEVNEVYKKIKKFDFIFLSADSENIHSHIDYIAKKYKKAFIHCYYLGYYGYVGPILSEKNKSYVIKENQYNFIGSHFNPPSTSPTNAIIANYAVLESLKYLTNIDECNLIEKVLQINFKTLETRIFNF